MSDSFSSEIEMEVEGVPISKDEIDKDEVEEMTSESEVIGSDESFTPW